MRTGIVRATIVCVLKLAGSAAIAMPPGGPPPNDNCGGAIALIPGPGCSPTAADATGATNSLPAATCGGFQGNADDDVWFSFTATAANHTVQVQGSAGFDAVLDLRSGGCASSSTVACADNEGPGGTESLVANGLTIGSNYFIRVYDFGAAPTTTTFTICVIEGGAPPNDLCSAALPQNLSPGSALVLSGNTSGATSTGDAVPGSPLDGVGPIVWHAFDLTDHARVAVSYCATFPVFTNVLSLLATGCPANSALIQADSANTTDCANGDWTVHYGCLDAGTYYLPVLGGPGANGPYFVFVIADPCPPANDECTGAVLLPAATPCVSTMGSVVGATGSLPANTCDGTTGVADDDVWYAFVATATSQTLNVLGGTGFNAVVELFGGSCGALVPLQCEDGTGDGGQETLVASGLVIGQLYHVRVFDHDGTAPLADTFLICLEGPAFTLTNDACATATPLVVHAYEDCPASATYGDNETASPDGTAACASTAGPDVWYAFNTGSETELMLRWDLLTADHLGVEVLDACGGASLACAATPDAELVFPTTPGTDLLVRVFTDPLSGTGGSFTLCLSTLPVVPDCDGASVRTAAFELETTYCSDGLPDVTGFITTSIATAGYAFVLCDASDNVIAVLPNDTLDADTLALGTYHVHGISFTGALVEASLAGTIADVGTDGDCLDLSDDHVTVNVELCNAMEEHGDAGAMLVPNPSEGDPVITWRTPLQGPLRLRLFDAAGREVIAHSRTDAPVRSVQLPWKDKLASGTYLLRVDAMDRTFTFNVIIQ